ncbi:MAG: TetR family transcriptional regulator [Sphingomonas sp.]|uniref:TetR/AcrR family transcriptional regulator n=1 Tax=Sphingomonas sp. TaxID=28214 RepID=UPI00260E18F4|nr:TetR/AcrR family transcriptional regulator [Sphingomonas sp.]MDK2768105.1 TetR family transcriptional regulator [Sphingomonas sp.]
MTAPTKGKRGRRPRSSKDASGHELLLDTAEELFATHGFHGVTAREVARCAGVDAALVVYYFGNKHKLFEAVFMRRAQIINRERLVALDAYAAAAGPELSVEGCIDAFIRPVLHWSMNGGPGWKRFFAITAQVNNTALWGGETMGRYFDPVVERLVDLLRIALPAASDEQLYWGYHMMTGALTLSLSETGRIDRLSHGRCMSGDLPTLFERFVPYAAAGFRGLVEGWRPNPL